MRGFVFYLAIGLLAALAQTSFLPLFFPPGLRPDLLLVLVIYLGLSEHMLRAVLLVLLLGGIQDSFSGTSLGLYVFVYLAVLLQVRLLSEHLNVESPPLLLLLIAGGTLVQDLLLAFCLTIFADVGSVVHILLPSFPLHVFVNLVAAAIGLFFILRIRPLFGFRSGLAGLMYQSKRHGS
ncbi:MAG: rod shape-determining protein MreD [Desulfuromonadales bacterium C00003093]|nr:MAG: rod shape-determining protein MreD [Desulfuromonadales bacterium C00003093]